MNVTETAKKTLFLLVFAFLIYYLVTEPANAAHVVRSIFNTIGEAFDSIDKFFRDLAS